MMILLPFPRDRSIAWLFLVTVPLSIFLLNIVRLAFRKGLRQVPGPFAARFTDFWRVGFVWKGDAHNQYRALHAKYGPIVRTAPNVVDISDPSAVPIIYGINSKYIKV